MRRYPRPMAHFCGKRLLCLLFGLMLMACSPMEGQPDLARLYRIGTEAWDTTPVILIPGLFGSKLRDAQTGQEVWPGGWSDVLLSDYRSLALRFDPVSLQIVPDRLEAFDIAETVIGRDFYGPIIDTLRRYGGYRRGVPGVPARAGERRYYLFPYDWRRDNVEQAQGLDRLIDAIRRDYRNPALRVDIVAHSMGGLIARYYLRYGPTDVLTGRSEQVTQYGTERVRKLVLLGTPNLGSASSLHAFLTGEPVGLGRIPPEVLATMPSGYQLFPHPLLTWMIDAQGHALHNDLFDAATWRRYRWSVFDPALRVRMEAQPGGVEQLEALQRFFAYRLERARRFLWSLSTPEPETPIRYVLFGGDCTLTPARLMLESENGQPVARLAPGDIERRVPGVPYEALMLEPGDGRVTKPSFLARESLDPTERPSEDTAIPIAYWFFLCERHDRLTGNINFQDNLLSVLLTRSLPWEMTDAAR